MPVEIYIQLAISLVTMLQGSYIVFILTLPLCFYNVRAYPHRDPV